MSVESREDSFRGVLPLAVANGRMLIKGIKVRSGRVLLLVARKNIL